jgi:hypothetical protein
LEVFESPLGDLQLGSSYRKDEKAPGSIATPVFFAVGLTERRHRFHEVLYWSEDAGSEIGWGNG